MLIWNINTPQYGLKKNKKVQRLHTDQNPQKAHITGEFVVVA